MPVNLPFIVVAYASLAWAVGLAVVAWLGSVLLGRPLSLGEWLVSGVVLAVAVVVIALKRRQRRQRQIEDMRDSALW